MNSLILLLVTIHAYLLPYLQLEAFVKVSGHAKELIGEVPDHTTGGEE
ncbi:hypothetical protein [Nitrososphaera sp. AFS]|nr:hypothetical protein [Nitrososphaera sp. AFS]